MKRRSPVTQAPRRQRSTTLSTTAPYKGLNYVDPQAAMDPSYALQLQNFIAQPRGCEIRTGDRAWATDIPTQVTSLLPYEAPIAVSSKLFAVAGDSFYDVTSGGAVGAAVVSGLNASAPYWESTQQTANASGVAALVAVNGSNMPQVYTGSAWIAATQVAVPSGVGEFAQVDNNGTAVNMSTFKDVLTHQQRLWFTAANSTKAYYCDIAQAGGALFLFDFGSLFPSGGALHKLATWTIDQGGSAGSSSLLVAISSRGDVVVFAGGNPASASTWGLSGTYKIGSPIGRRCTKQHGGDLLILCQQGLIAMSRLVQSAVVNTQQTITYNISPVISDIASALATTPGFEIAIYPAKDLILLNIPQADQSNNFQFVQNTISGGWSQFTGWPARCFCLFNNALYFGSGTTVQLSFIGAADAADINGQNGNTIIATALTAYHQGGSYDTGVMKHVKLVKPYITTGDSNPTIRIGVNTDYNLIPITGSATLNPITGAVWDSATWDNPGSVWVGSLVTFNQWATPLCFPGEALALAISISATAETMWVGTLWVYEAGGTFG